MTVFMPTDDAIEDFHRDLIELNSIDFDEEEEISSKRKKRDLSVTETPRLQDIILAHMAHMTEGFVATSDMEDETMMPTEAGEKKEIRMNIYNTYPQRVIMANCAKIISRNNFATNGIVHMVDKVIVPAKHTVGEIITEDLGLQALFKSRV